MHVGSLDGVIKQCSVAWDSLSEILIQLGQMVQCDTVLLKLSMQGPPRKPQ